MAKHSAPTKEQIMVSLSKLGTDAHKRNMHGLVQVYVASVLRLGVELGVLRPDGSHKHLR